MKKEAHNHPKMRRLVNRLQRANARVAEQTMATGLLERLWHYAIEQHRETGILVGVDDEILSAEIGWVGAPSELVGMLVETGWLDRLETGELAVHDWTTHCPQWAKNAYKGAVKLAEYNERRATSGALFPDAPRPAAKKAQADDSPVMFDFPCGAVVTQDVFNRLVERYPDVDVEHEIRIAIDWKKGKKGKTISPFSFLNNWMSKKQDGPPSSKPKEAPDDTRMTIEETTQLKLTREQVDALIEEGKCHPWPSEDARKKAPPMSREQAERILANDKSTEKNAARKAIERLNQLLPTD